MCENKQLHGCTSNLCIMEACLQLAIDIDTIN